MGLFARWFGQSTQAAGETPVSRVASHELGDLLSAVVTVNPGLHVYLDESGVVLSGEVHEGCRVCMNELVPGVEVFAQLPNELREIMREVFQRAVATGEVQALESDLGEEPDVYRCAIWMVPVSDGRIYAYGRDISAGVARDEEERALQEQLRRLHKMEALGQLAGGVAHDFNNLLTVITGHAELLRAQLPPGAPGFEDLDRIDEASQSAASLTRRLLDFSRTHVLRPETVDLNQMIGHLQRFLDRLLREDVSLELELEDGLHVIRADTASIEQLLVSLADNAADAMPQGGVFRISTANVTLTEDDLETLEGGHLGEYVELRLTDTGSGMSPETRRRAFEPFFTTKSLVRGTGLGLASVYKIVQRSDALIQLTSEEGKGTSFRILFPLALQPQVAVPEGGAITPQAKGLGGQETILLCEDNDAVRGVIAETLVGAGYTVMAASSPGQALEIEDAHDDVLQMLVTDMVMPGKTGAQLASELRDRRPGLRVLFVSGHSAGVLQGHDEFTDEDSLLPKPFTPRDLLDRVRELLDRREARVWG